VNQTIIVILLVAIAIAVALAAFFFFRHYRDKRARHIREHFGPEYSRLAEEKGTVAAEKELAVREKRAAKFEIRPLSAEDRRRFISGWQEAQKAFVDDPKGSLSAADELIAKVMAARGYPVQDFEQRAADLSVDHPIVVQHYRAAHGIALRHSNGQTTTEDLRQAMIHYRALFDDLLSDQPSHAHAAE
jgi:hypothetical protein